MSSSESVIVSRRQLFRRVVTGQRSPLRPPWALAEARFTSNCDRCNDCISACPEGVIRSGSGGFPEMDFSQRGCTLCGRCVTVCGGKALTGAPGRNRPWTLTAQIGQGCLAGRGVVCRSCGEACDERAIRFQLRAGGAARPLLDTVSCTGCGSCVGVCPVKAVVVRTAGETGSSAKAAQEPEIGAR